LGRDETPGQSSGARGLSRVSNGARSGAVASRPVSGLPRFHRSRIVRITDVWWWTSLTTVRSEIQGEIAIAGSRTPSRLKVKPI